MNWNGKLGLKVLSTLRLLLTGMVEVEEEDMVVVGIRMEERSGGMGMGGIKVG